MPTPKKNDPTDDAPVSSTFASRKADRQAREAAGEVPEPRRQRGGFRAGVDAEPVVNLVVTHVRN
jgi:hypothetical protein